MYLIICVLSLLTSCTKTPVESRGESDLSESSSNLEFSIDEEVTDAVTEAIPEEEEQETLYELFLKNDATVHIDNSSNVGYYFSFTDSDGRDVTLEELVQVIIDYYNEDNEYVETKLEKIEYAYLDCGKDGNEELALRIFTPGIDYWTLYIIIKEIDGQLIRTVYSNVEWSRGQTFITEYGYVYSDGSGGASHHVFTKEYIDAGGKYNFIYTNNSSDFSIGGDYAGDIFFNGESHNLLEETKTIYLGNFTFFELDLNNTPEDDSDDIYSYAKTGDYDDSGEGVRGYYYCQIEDEPGLFDDRYALKKYCNEHGLKIYSKDEFEGLIADKEKAVGLTDEIKNGKTVTWQELEYAQYFSMKDSPESVATQNDISDYIGAYDEIFSGETNEYYDMAIGVDEDGTIKLYIGMVRISTLSDGVGEMTEEGLTFTATDPAGNEISGIVLLDGDKATLSFTSESEWARVLNEEKLEYIKCTNNPHDCEGYDRWWGTP